MGKSTRLLTFVTLALIALCTARMANGQPVENFVLLDHQGDAHELYYHRSATAIVVMSHTNQCAQDEPEITAFNQLVAAMTGKDQVLADDRDMVFFMLNSSLDNNREAIRAEAQRLNIEVPILTDETQLIGEALKLDSSGEILVIDPQSWQIVYRGDHHGATQALAALSNDQVPTLNSADATGCAVSYPNRDQAAHQQISYRAEVAPILKEKCVVCHTEGGLGPWAMSDYNMILGFAPMIREVLRTKRMPPWHADPHIGTWRNDISLSTEQTRTLVHWIEAGAPRGQGSDPLLQTAVAAVEWPLGKPDLILDIPAHTVPVSGVVDYQFPTVKNPLDHGVWIKAATVVPGDREVVHHILAGTVNADATELRRNSGVFDNYLIGYAPGNESHTFPDDTGVFIEPGGEFLFQLHYTPVGRETTDRSRIGLYFHKEKPGNFYRQSVVIDPTITIPANAARHAEVAYYQFDKPALLHDLVPHAHYRGVASKFELVDAQNSKRTLLSVPNYDFNWQRTYEFEQPIEISAGSRLIHTTWYDNSAANPANPDAEREVPWGLQSWDEMLYGAFSYTYLDETTDAPIHDDVKSQTAQYVGFLDANLDGKVSWRELPKNIKKRLVQGFKAVDANGDGSLDLEEMYQLTLRQREARARSNDQQAEAETDISDAR